MTREEPDDHASEAPRTGDRSRCPTCRAFRAGRSECGRCGADLTPLEAVERRAADILGRAREEYARGRFILAAELAERSARLLADPDALHLAACARLRSGSFREALRAARAAER